MNKLICIIGFFMTLVIFSCNKSDKGNIPICEITFPDDHSEITAGQIVTINIEASDKDGIIAEVQLFIDGNSKHLFTARPYSFVWNTKTEITGSKKITAVCIDDSGNSAEDSITVVLIKP